MKNRNAKLKKAVMLPRAETTVSRSSSDPEFVVNTEKHVSEVLGGFWEGSGGVLGGSGRFRC